MHRNTAKPLHANPFSKSEAKPATDPKSLRLTCRETEEEGDADADAGSSPESEEDEEGEKLLTRNQVIRGAVTYLLVGTAACAFFSDPMVDAVTNFSRVGFCNLHPLIYS